MVITDGQQTTDRGSFTELSEASRGLKDKNVNVFSLGIGSGVNETQLTDIASSAKNVFTAPTFADLTPAADTIVENSCTGKLGLNVKDKKKKTRENTNLFSKVIRDESETGRTDNDK